MHWPGSRSWTTRSRVLVNSAHLATFNEPSVHCLSRSLSFQIQSFIKLKWLFVGNRVQTTEGGCRKAQNAVGVSLGPATVICHDPWTVAVMSGGTPSLSVPLKDQPPPYTGSDCCKAWSAVSSTCASFNQCFVQMVAKLQPSLNQEMGGAK